MMHTQPTRESLQMPSMEAQTDMANALQSINALINKLNRNQDSDDNEDCISVLSDARSWVTDNESTASSAIHRSRDRHIRRIVWPDGTYFQGSLRQGTRRPDGVGELYLSNGDSYKGEWRDGVISGYGIYTLATGGRYEGRIKDNQRHGYGRLSCRSGVVYEGGWANDKPNGFGTMTAQSGTVQYTGNWLDGRTHGQGTYVSDSWGRYTGEWKCDKMDGQGRVEYTSGATYDGGWAAGQPHGYARYTWPNGNTYEGRFDHGKMTGQGKFAMANRKQHYSGTWKDNMKNGYGEMRFADGALYRGEWKDDRPEGEGIFINPYGVTFRGIWREGRFDPEASGEDPRGIHVCLMETSSYQASREADNLFIDDRLVIPAPDPGSAEMEAAMPLPRKFLNPEDPEPEISSVFVSRLHPINDPMANCDAGYLYKTRFSIDYYPHPSRVNAGGSRANDVHEEIIETRLLPENEARELSQSRRASEVVQGTPLHDLIITNIPTQMASYIPTEEVNTNIINETRVWVTPAPHMGETGELSHNRISSQYPVVPPPSPQIQAFYEAPPVQSSVPAPQPPAPPSQQTVIIMRSASTPGSSPRRSQGEQSIASVTPQTTRTATHLKEIGTCPAPELECHQPTIPTSLLPAAPRPHVDKTVSSSGPYRFHWAHQQEEPPQQHNNPIETWGVSSSSVSRGRASMPAAVIPAGRESLSSAVVLPPPREVFWNSSASRPVSAPPTRAKSTYVIPPPLEPAVLHVTADRLQEPEPVVAERVSIENFAPDSMALRQSSARAVVHPSTICNTGSQIVETSASVDQTEINRCQVITDSARSEPVRAIFYPGAPIHPISESNQKEVFMASVDEQAEEEVIAEPIPGHEYLEIEIPRRIPLPAEARTLIELKLPQIRTTKLRVEYPVYAPRFIEIPVPFETLSAEGLRICEELNQQLALLQSLPNISACELDTLAGNVVAALRTAEAIEGSHLRPQIPTDLSGYTEIVTMKGDFGFDGV